MMPFGFMMLIVMIALNGLSNEYGGQVSKNKRLNKGNHDFNEVNEYSKQHREWRKAPACNCTHRTKYENQRDET